jgi:probable rRNA maturation factor
MKVEINNQVQISADLESVIKQTLEEASVFIRKNEKIPRNCKIELSIAIIDRKEILKVNLDYRDVEDSTDVLSFCYRRNDREIGGEILLCWDVIKENAESDGIDSETELKKNLIHGLLHVIGFNHSKEMFAFQKEILELQ